MEILGIVWAASIITPSSIIASATDMIGRRTQLPESPIPVEAAAPWLASLVEASLPVPDTATLPTPQGSTTSLLISNADTLAVVDETDTTQPDAFQALVPHISAELDSLENLLEQPVSEDAALVTEDSDVSRWHHWTSIATVQVVDRDVPPSDSTISLPDSVCLREATIPYQESALVMKTAARRQLWVNNQFIGDVAGDVSAQKLAQKMRSLIQANVIDAAQIQLLTGANFIGATHGDDILFVVDETMRSHPEVSATVTAVQWINNLRKAFGERPLGLSEIQMTLAGLTETSETLFGTASWYGPGFHGRKTANGEIFDENALTAAHKTLPFNTLLKVTNRLNGQSVVVRINDRGPYIGKRSLDLSKTAAHCLGSTYTGVVPYEAVILTPADEMPELADVTTAQLATELTELNEPAGVD